MTDSIRERAEAHLDDLSNAPESEVHALVAFAESEVAREREACAKLIEGAAHMLAGRIRDRDRALEKASGK